MDNRSVDVTSKGREDFEAMMKIVMQDHKYAQGYAVHPTLGLVLVWHHDRNEKIKTEIDTEGMPRTSDPTWREEYEKRAAKIVEVPVEKLPYKMNLKAAIEFAWNWLESADYPEKPDIDGSSYKGWRMHTDNWGHVGTSHYGIVGIVPTWAMSGK